MYAINAGWEVIRLDTSQSKNRLLNCGRNTIEDISDDAILSALKNSKYKATADFSLAKDADVVTLCVPTPLNKNREPDLSAINEAINALAKFLKNGTLIVSESTSFPGTLRNVIIPSVRHNRNNGIKGLLFAVAPERLNPGDVRWSLKNTPRLIAGIDSESQIAALDFYKTFCDEVLCVETPEIAEAAKLLENTFRLVNIALINEFARICDSATLDVNKVIDAAISKPYGFMEFRPGVGLGGHCIPVDPLYLTWWARQNSVAASIVELSDLINRNMHKFVAEKALKLLNGDLNKNRILILGVSYKSGISDVRESPVEFLFNYFKDQGFNVEWYDSTVKEWNGTTSVSKISDFDLAIIAVNQQNHPISELIQLGIPILDCTNTFDSSDGITRL